MWSVTDRVVAGDLKASITANGDVTITNFPADGCRVYLSPDMGIKLSAPIRVSHRSKKVRAVFDGKLDTMLEDVRTRADRKKFYWMAVDLF